MTQKKIVAITVQGAAKTGKSAIAQAIAAALKAEGFEVVNTDRDPPRPAPVNATALLAATNKSRVVISIRNGKGE